MSKEQVVDKGIKQKSTKEWTHSLMAVPFVRGHRTVSPQTPRNACTYTRHPAQCHVWRVDMVLGQTHQKNGMRVKTSTDPGLKKEIAGLYGIRCKLVKKITLNHWNTRTTNQPSYKYEINYPNNNRTIVNNIYFDLNDDLTY